MTLGERITLLIEKLGLNQTTFAEEIGAKKQTVSRVCSDAATPNYSFIEKILTRYDNVSSEWLTRGKGQMMKAIGETGQPKTEAMTKKWDDITLKEFIGLLKERSEK